MSDRPPPPLISAVPPLPDAWHIQRFKILAGARLAVRGADADIQAAWRSDVDGKTSGEMRRLATRATAKVWTVEDGDLIESLKYPMLEPFPIVEQFPGGRWLITNARSDGRGNARILSVDGAEERRIELGDGIAHIQIDNMQRIWVGWFDEGVFGNGNWHFPGLKWAPSSHGIAAFDERGTLLNHANLESIADCYALNVAGDGTWSCTYTDFPLLRMADEGERTWPTKLSGVSAIAVSYPYVLAAGGYQNDANRAVLLKLEEHSVHPVSEWRLPFGAGDEIDLICGRDDELHVVRDQEWHRWRVTDFIEHRR